MAITHAHNMYKVYVTVAALWLLTASVVMAQEDTEYRYEVGAGVGIGTYYGDFNSSLFGNVAPAGTAMFKFVLNPHSAMTFAGTYTKAKGEYKVDQTYYPDMQLEGYSYNTDLFDLSAVYEYNFWPYGTGKEYRGAVRLAPFIAVGVGLTGARCDNRTMDYSALERTSSNNKVVTANIPLGIGVKYRYGDRTNFSLQWMMHFSLSDHLDGAKDPYRVKSDGLFKNTDCYSVLTFCVTYSFAPKCPTCMKDR